MRNSLNTLQISEIVQEVVKYVAGDPENPNRSQLLSLSLVCKDLYEESMDALWYDMKELDPLLRLIPAVMENGKWLLKESLADNACPRFHIQRMRIKRFTWVSGRRTKPDLFSYTRLSRLPGGFLPELRFLRIFQMELSQDPTTVAAISALLSSNTCRQIRFTNLVDRIGTFLPILCETDTRLETLSLCCTLAGSCFGQLSWAHLVKVKLDIPLHDITLDLFRGLASMALLLDLSVFSYQGQHDYKEIEFSNSVKHLFPTALPKLQSFFVSLPPDAATTLLEMVSSTRLNIFRFEQHKKFEPSLDELIRISDLVSSFPKVNLVFFDLFPQNCYGNSHSSFFRPLYQLDLSGFDLSSTTEAFDLGDSDIADMASAWPNLRSLTIKQRWKDEPTFTITSLQRLATSCLQLKSLEISISHVSDIPLRPPAATTPVLPLEEGARPTPEPVSRSLLTGLDLSGSIVEHIPNLARHLNRLFPMLKNIQVKTGDAKMELLRTSVFELRQATCNNTECSVVDSESC